MRLEEKLEALAQDYEHKAAAIRTTALALSSTLRKKAEADFPTKLRKAVATQSNGHKANGNGHRQLHWTKRPENAAKLAKMQRKGARTRWVQQHPEVNRPPAAEPADNKRRSKLLAQRQRSFDILQQFTTEPRVVRDARLRQQLGPLVRRGYLEKRDGGGYARTGKEFTVRP